MVVSGSPERRGLASGAGAPDLGSGCQSVHGTDGLLPAHHLGPHRGASAPTPCLPPPLRLQAARARRVPDRLADAITAVSGRMVWVYVYISSGVACGLC